MSVWIERGGFLAAIVVASGLLAAEGHAQARLEDQLPMSPKELYDLVGHGRKVQVVDVRALRDDADYDVGGFEATHVPGALPVPGCDAARAPEGATVLETVPTVIVTRDGDDATFRSCAAKFVRARKLDGGMKGWLDAMLPEDMGPYIKPSMGAGGGCL